MKNLWIRDWSQGPIADGSHSSLSIISENSPRTMLSKAKQSHQGPLSRVISSRACGRGEGGQREPTWRFHSQTHCNDRLYAYPCWGGKKKLSTMTTFRPGCAIGCPPRNKVEASGGAMTAWCEGLTLLTCRPQSSAPEVSKPTVGGSSTMADVSGSGGEFLALRSRGFWKHGQTVRQRLWRLGRGYLPANLGEICTSPEVSPADDKHEVTL